jgi:hypothetical protein
MHKMNVQLMISSSIDKCVVAVSAVYCSMPVSVSTQKSDLSDDSISQTSDEPRIGMGKGSGCVGKKRGGTSGKPQKKSKRKKLKKQGADAPTTSASQQKQSDKANSVLNLLGKHAQLQQKVKLPTLNRCWSWQYWRPADEKYGTEPIILERFEELRGMRPRLQCLFCDKSMAWSPSTTRKGHLLLHCKAFSKSNEFKDPKVITDREELMRKTGSQKHVRTLASCYRLQRIIDCSRNCYTTMAQPHLLSMLSVLRRRPKLELT